VLNYARVNAVWLMCTARDATGQRVVASDVLLARRHAEARAVACRCGRDAQTPTRTPRATFCLACEGVLIHEDNVNRDVRVGMRWELKNLSARFPLHLNGGVNAPVVVDVADNGP